MTNSKPAHPVEPAMPALNKDPTDNGARLICWLKIAVLGALFGFIFRHELVRLYETWKIPDESHGILIPAFSLYFLWKDREQLKQLRSGFSVANLIGVALLAGCFWAYAFTITRHIITPGLYLMIPALAGIVLAAAGWPILKRVWLPILFLFFAFQLPPGIHDRITNPLREWSSVIATVVLDFLPGVSCESAGVTISGTYNDEPFDLNVADACSGMRLLRTFVALGVAMAWLEKRSVSQRVVLLISTIPIAILCNMLRVVLTGLIYLYIGPQYARGMLHALLGLLMLGMAFWLYGVLAWFMNNLFSETRPEPEQPQDILIITQPDRNDSGQ